MGHPVLVQHFALDGVVTLVDALSGAASLAERPEARRQVACADRLVLTKTDLAPETGALRHSLRHLNARAPLVAVGDAGPVNSSVRPRRPRDAARRRQRAGWERDGDQRDRRLPRSPLRPRPLARRSRIRARRDPLPVADARRADGGGRCRGFLDLG